MSDDSAKDKDPDPKFGFETLAVHAGAAPDPVTGSRAIPIHQTTSFVFDDAEHAASLFNLQVFGNIYTRLTNPTVAVLEQRMAGLENGRGALCASSGHAAQLLVFHVLMEAGDHFVSAQQLYGGSLTQFSQSFKKMGWDSTTVDARDPENFRAALQPNTKAIFIENLANPGGIVIHMQAVADIAHEAGIPLIVDSTLATPFLNQPFEWGADIIVHSLTKFLGGHGNSLGGVLVDSGKFDWAQGGKFPTLTEPQPSYHGLRFYETFGDMAFSIAARVLSLRDLGPALSPQNAFYILTGIETLPLRMERQCANAFEVATFLEAHPKVEWVSYAGLKSSPYYDLGQKYLPKGAGAVLTFGVKGGFDAGVKIVENVDLFSHLANIGDTRSLILHPASTTHRQLSEEAATAAGAAPDVIRLSVGIETVDDLKRDLDQALAQV
jgi:O-acetylhomoserine (thiol)-lyase